MDYFLVNNDGLGIIKNIKIEKKGSVRQSKLYYMRKLKGKASKIKERI